MSRRKTNRINGDSFVAGFFGLIGFLIILSIPSYWFLSGATLNYTMKFWMSAANNGELVSFPAWPGYVGGGFLGGLPIMTGGVTYVIDKANVIENDPFPN